MIWVRSMNFLILLDECHHHQHNFADCGGRSYKQYASSLRAQSPLITQYYPPRWISRRIVATNGKRGTPRQLMLSRNKFPTIFTMLLINVFRLAHFSSIARRAEFMLGIFPLTYHSYGCIFDRFNHALCLFHENSRRLAQSQNAANFADTRFHGVRHSECIV